MTEIKIQNDCRQKWIDKKYVETKNCAKTVLQCRILKASKSDVNGWDTKAKVQTTSKFIQLDAWTRTGTKRCNAKTGEYQTAVSCKNVY